MSKHKTIWKFTLGLAEENILEVPRGSELLSIQNQRDEITLWFLVPLGERGRAVNPIDKDTRRFSVKGTGWNFEMDGDWKFRATIQIGGFVWHVFEILGG